VNVIHIKAKRDQDPLRMQYGPITHDGHRKFYYWFIGGHFEWCAGEFSEPFETLEEARLAACKVGLVEHLKVSFDPNSDR
jgi:hypothetical protein